MSITKSSVISHFHDYYEKINGKSVYQNLLEDYHVGGFTPENVLKIVEDCVYVGYLLGTQRQDSDGRFVRFDHEV